MPATLESHLKPKLLGFGAFAFSIKTLEHLLVMLQLLCTRLRGPYSLTKASRNAHPLPSRTSRWTVPRPARERAARRAVGPGKCRNRPRCSHLFASCLAQRTELGSMHRTTWHAQPMAFDASALGSFVSESHMQPLCGSWEGIAPACETREAVGHMPCSES